MREGGIVHGITVVMYVFPDIFMAENMTSTTGGMSSIYM